MKKEKVSLGSKPFGSPFVLIYAVYSKDKKVSIPIMRLLEIKNMYIPLIKSLTIWILRSSRRMTGEIATSPQKLSGLLAMTDLGNAI